MPNQLYTIIKVARNEDLTNQIGRDVYFDLVDHDKVHTFRIQKQMPFNQFKEKVANEFCIPVQFQRFWLWKKRINNTHRPFGPLTSLEEELSVGQLGKISNEENTKELKLYLEVELDSHFQPVAPPEKTKEDIILFFKLYDPLKEELRYVGRLLVNERGKPVDILKKLNKMAGFRDNEEIELFEEIMFEPSIICEPIDKEVTFLANELEDGDIICFQKSQVAIGKQCPYPDVPSFLESLREPKENSIEAPQEQAKPASSQTVIPAAHETEPPPTSVPDLTPEQSVPMASPSADIEEKSEHIVPLVAKTDVCTSAKPSSDYTFGLNEDNDVPESKEEIILAEDMQEEAKMTILEPPQKQTVVEDEISSMCFSEFDTLFGDIQNLLKGRTTEGQTSTSFQPPQLTNEEISRAKKTFRQCLNMKLANIIQMGREHELKNSLSVILTVNPFRSNMIRDMFKFLTNFDRSHELYMAAQQELKEAREKENSVSELKTTLKQLSLQFMPIRNRAKEVDQEVAKLEIKLAEMKAEKAELRKSLQDLARRADSSRQILINAEEDRKLFMLKKEQAEKMVGGIERSWESLKADCSQLLL